MSYKLPLWVVAAACLAIAIGAMTLPTRSRQARAFDAALWKAAGANDDPSYPRQPMADDLIAHGELIGKSHAEVEDELGLPDRTEGERQWAYYWTGPERHFISIDSEWLAVRYDATGLVVKVVLTSD